MKAWPQKRGRVFGKQIEASMWFAAIASSRSFCFHIEGCTASKVVTPNSSTSAPAATEVFMSGVTRSS